MLVLRGRQTELELRGRLGHQFAHVVYQGHVVGGEVRHARGNQVHDGLNLRLRNRPTRVGRNHHRRLGRRAVTHEHTLLGRGKVHAGALYAANLHDASGQLLLHGGVDLDLLHELAGGHGRLVFQSIQACGACLGQTLRSQKNAGLMKTVRGHGQLTRGWVDFGAVFGLFEGFKSRLLIGLQQARHDGSVRRGLHHGVGQTKHHQHKQHHDQGQHPAHGRLRDHIFEGLGKIAYAPRRQRIGPCGL